MAHLTLAGVSDDGRRLLLLDDQGDEFTLDITPRLRAALRGETSRLGQLEIQMTSALRPRDIQTRIRSGESAEAVAEAAGTTVDKIMAFAGPVLAERAHIAQRAQQSSVRRSPGESGGARSLGDSVSVQLRSANVDPELVEWDAWRREDGRWSLVGSFEAPQRTGIAQFTYDPPGNYVLLDNEDARWLVGEAVVDPVRISDDLQEARQRRLSAVPEDELPLGDDAIELVAGPEADTSQPAGSAAEAFLDDSPASDDVESREEAADAAADDRSASETTEIQGEVHGEVEPEADAEAGTEPGDKQPPTRKVQKKRGRASVPSWDEIMFGGSSE